MHLLEAFRLKLGQGSAEKLGQEGTMRPVCNEAFMLVVPEFHDTLDADLRLCLRLLTDPAVSS